MELAVHVTNIILLAMHTINTSTIDKNHTSSQSNLESCAIWPNVAPVVKSTENS